MPKSHVLFERPLSKSEKGTKATFVVTESQTAEVEASVQHGKTIKQFAFVTLICHHTIL